MNTNQTTPILLTGNYHQIINDCACAISHPLQSNYFSSDNYKIHNQNDSINLNKQFSMLFNPNSPINPTIINKSAWHRYQDFAQKTQPLTQKIDYQFAQQNLIIPESATHTTKQQRTEIFTVWLHVTNVCNLDCSYCYVNKTTEQMDEIIGKNAINQIIQTAQQKSFKTIKIKFAGGEPLLNFKLIQTLHNYAQKQLENTNIKLQSVILTNGTLISEKISSWIKQNNIKLMLSIDGLFDAHDKQRPAKNGKSNFAQIIHNLDNCLLPLDIKPDISITVTQKNAANLAETVIWVLERKLPFSLNFYRQNLQTKSHQELKLEEDIIIQGMLAAYKAIEQNLPDYPLSNGLLDRLQPFAHTQTCGVDESYLVIDHHGRHRQCHTQLEQTTFGNIPIQTTPKIQNLPVDEKQGCKDCEYRYFCTGGCPIETYNATGRWDVKSPHCNIYKTLFPELLRLEGLRLLKVNHLI
ncbi:radical SAM protein [Candidatus Albibeggiatoa sp. nov. NOAA]|uniref:radical SAM/SPASM domain-containing protein n=1 Tax=Candidatus Albibeggiatoa sp. nov. NOAA TaxID=3162724 RepID=UPI0032F57443|nr:radical SAM protein [Thiotrichaceae bacterium]